MLDLFVRLTYSIKLIFLHFSDDEEEDEEDSTLENQYYNSKATKEESLKEALDGFAKVITLQSEKGEWGFKALKQMLKINFKLGKAIKTLIKVDFEFE